MNLKNKILLKDLRTRLTPKQVALFKLVVWCVLLMVCPACMDGVLPNLRHHHRQDNGTANPANFPTNHFLSGISQNATLLVCLHHRAD